MKVVMSTIDTQQVRATARRTVLLGLYDVDPNPPFDIHMTRARLAAERSVKAFGTTIAAVGSVTRSLGDFADAMTRVTMLTPEGVATGRVVNAHGMLDIEVEVEGDGKRHLTRLAGPGIVERWD